MHDQALLECDLYAVGESPPRTYAFGLRWGTDIGAYYRHVLVQRHPNTLGNVLPEAVDFDADLRPHQRISTTGSHRTSAKT